MFPKVAWKQMVNDFPTKEYGKGGRKGKEGDSFSHPLNKEIRFGGKWKAKNKKTSFIFYSLNGEASSLKAQQDKIA